MNTYCVKYFDNKGNVCVTLVPAANRVAAFHTLMDIYANAGVDNIEIISIVREEDI